MPLDAFLSHSSEDAALVKRLKLALEADRLAVWLDRTNIRPGFMLRDEIQAGIRDSRVLVLVWSKAASKTRWVAAEILTAFHVNRFIVACVRDDTPLPYFLQNALYLQVQPRRTEWLAQLGRGIRDAPAAANEIPGGMRNPPADVEAAARRLALEQYAILDLLNQNDVKGASVRQAALDPAMKAAEAQWRFQARILNLAGYHRKNAYMLRHWPEIQAYRQPRDPLLVRAERRFFDSLFADPLDYEALNGLGSILYFEREYHAAEFFIRRALALARKAGVRYSAAESDLALVLRARGGN